MAETSNPIRIRLEPQILMRLERFCALTRRSRANAVNALLDSALLIAESGNNLDQFMNAPQHTEEP